MNKQLYYDMLRIRMIEERIALKYPEGKMRCPVHLSVGQEAAAVGVCASLSKDDKMVSTHRGHAHYLAKGGSLKGLIGELYGKQSGCSRGNGGSMHLIDLSVGFYGSTSIVGGTIPVGVGLAFADRLKGSNAKTVICIGDAAVEEGVFHEAANFAALHDLNVTFFCENNKYSCYTFIRQRANRANAGFGEFEKIAEGHGLKYLYHPPLDRYGHVQTVYLNPGPQFIEYPTFRHLEHCGPNNDDHLGYRDKDYIADGRQSDEVRCLDHSWLAQINQEIDEAFADAEAAPFPDESEVGRYVYANT